MSFNYFFSISFVPYVGIAFLFIFLYNNKTIDNAIKRIFFTLLFLEFIELAFYNLEYWTSTFPQPTFARMLFSSLGYSIRIITIYLFLLISTRNQGTVKSKIIWAIPVIINIFIAFSVFFTDIAYSFSADNHFQRGPLGYTSHIIFLFYLISILLINIKGLHGRPFLESLIVFMIIAFSVTSIMTSTFFAVDNLGISSTILSTIFYYMFFQTQTYHETISAEQRNREIFEIKSNTDEATGVLNKTAFLKTASDMLCSDTAHKTVLVFVDLDNFKNVNDTLGHLIGDIVLKDTARKLQKVFRNADIIGRFGGDEFCIFLHNIPKEKLRQRLDEVLRELKAVYSAGSYSIKVTASIGAVYCTDNYNMNIETLLNLADQAAYEAKRNGRNQYVIKQYLP